MRVIVGDRTHEGRAIELMETDVSAEAVVRAIRNEKARVRVDCRPSGAAHDHVGRLPPETFDRRAALAAAARALGNTSPARSALDEARTQLAELSPPSVDVDAARRRVAETGSAEFGDSFAETLLRGSGLGDAPSKHS